MSLVASSKKLRSMSIMRYMVASPSNALAVADLGVIAILDAVPFLTVRPDKPNIITYSSEVMPSSFNESVFDGQAERTRPIGEINLFGLVAQVLQAYP